MFSKPKPFVSSHPQHVGTIAWGSLPLILCSLEILTPNMNIYRWTFPNVPSDLNLPFYRNHG